MILEIHIFYYINLKQIPELMKCHLFWKIRIWERVSRENILRPRPAQLSKTIIVYKQTYTKMMCLNKLPGWWKCHIYKKLYIYILILKNIYLRQNFLALHSLTSLEKLSKPLIVSKHTYSKIMGLNKFQTWWKCHLLLKLCLAKKLFRKTFINLAHNN